MGCRTVQSRKVIEALYIGDAIRTGLGEMGVGECSVGHLVKFVR